MMELDRNEASAKGRPLAIHLGIASLRAVEGYREVLGTMDRINIVAAVTAGGRANAASRDNPDAGCTIAQVASLSSSDKETARRQIQRLVESGVLRRNGNGVVQLDPSFVRGAAFRAALCRHAAAIARLVNSFCDQGVLVGRDAGCLDPSPVITEHGAWAAAEALLLSVQRHAQAYRELVGTTDRVLVVLSVLAITSGHLTRTALPSDLQDVRTPMPRERLGACNVSSIAAAAGLPFETTRRKVLELVEHGSLVKVDKGGVQFAPGVLQRPAVYDLVTRNAAEVVELACKLERLGVLGYSKAVPEG